MSFRTTHARYTGLDTTDNARKAVERINGELAGFAPALLIYFASTAYDPDCLAAEMQKAFPGAVTMGATTAGEGVDGLYLGGSVVVMAFSENVFDYCRTALILGGGQRATEGDVFTSVDEAMGYLGGGLYMNLRNLSYRDYVGFVLADRMSFFSEATLERVGELTDVFFLGGFAGDDYKFDRSQRVFYRGRSYVSAAIVALWKPRNGFSLLKTQAVEMSRESLIITRADEYRRIVWEFNGEPAAQVYARWIGVAPDRLTPQDFDENPLAASADGEPFLRVPVRTVDGGGLEIYASVKEGTRLVPTRAGDILAVSRAALDEKFREGGPFSAMLNMDCVSRFTSLKRRNELSDYIEIFRSVPNISMASYGEIYIDIVSLTLTAILFK